MARSPACERADASPGQAADAPERRCIASGRTLDKSELIRFVVGPDDRVVADFVLARFDLLRHLDLVVTRDDVTALKPDPDGLRVVRERWPEAPHIVMVGDAWVDGLAAQAGGVPFIAYRADAAELERRGVIVTARITSLLDLPAALA